jgi:hypothetical protein
MKWLDEISYVFLIGAAVLMAMMPFKPEPHLLEKFHMFMAGTLHKPMDIFDVFWHLLPTILLSWKLLRAFYAKGES